MKVNLRILIISKLLILGCLILSCRPKLEPSSSFETFNDFENSLGWVDPASNNFSSVTHTFGYNSSSCIHLNQKHPFGYMFRLKFFNLKERVNCAIVEFDVKLNSPSAKSCVLACTVEDLNDKVINWQEQRMNDLNKEKWIHYSKKFRFDGLDEPENRINIFFWNHDSGQELFIDNVRIKFLRVFDQ